MLGSISTEELADNIDKLATDPEKTADILNELAGRDQDEISGLSREEKEKLLEKPELRTITIQIEEA